MKHISKKLYNYFDASNIFNKNQHGFHQNISTVTQLIQTVHDFRSAINEKGQTDAVCLDMSKAFDCVPHDKLIQKLYSYGINYNVILWIQAYLSGRSQVVIDGVTSDTQHLPSGVPQGSLRSGPVPILH